MAIERRFWFWGASRTDTKLSIPNTWDWTPKKRFAWHITGAPSWRWFGTMEIAVGRSWPELSPASIVLFCTVGRVYLSMWKSKIAADSPVAAKNMHFWYSNLGHANILSARAGQQASRQQNRSTGRDSGSAVVLFGICGWELGAEFGLPVSRDRQGESMYVLLIGICLLNIVWDSMNWISLFIPLTIWIVHVLKQYKSTMKYRIY